MSNAGLTAEDVARWMLEQVTARPLYQEDAVWKIKRQFGDEFVYSNDNGNLAIGKDVLKVFRELTGDEVIWERGQRLWRKRNKVDGAGRQQD